MTQNSAQDLAKASFRVAVAIYYWEAFTFLRIFLDVLPVVWSLSIKNKYTITALSDAPT